MPPPAPARRPAGSPDQLHRRRLDAINRRDVGDYLELHDDDATVVIPTDGRTAHGRREISIAVLPLFALDPELSSAIVTRLESPRLAILHLRWRLTLTDHGCRIDMSGLGTTVSRRRPDGTWRIVLDDPFTGA